jgi:membrane AbrB-like protein
MATGTRAATTPSAHQRTGVRRAPLWIAIAGGVVAGGVALDAVGLPSSYLFAALLLGLAIALRRPDRVALPPLAFRAAQAVAGVTLGAYLQTEALRAVAGALVPVLVVSAATLGLSLAAGAILARTTPLDPPTALLGMIAGGASGIVGMSGELGADDRLVAFMQYLRVLVVVLLTPIGIAVLFGGEHGSGGTPPPSAGLLGAPWEWAAAAALALAGAWAAGRLRVTAGVLLGPMIVTGALVLAGPLEGFAVPDLLGQAAFALIGLQVGLRFTPETVRLLGRLTGPVLLAIAGLLVTCFGLAVLLDATTSATLLDAYLATTPGGLYAVLAVAFGSGADTTFIVAVQALRVVAMVLLAPLAVRWLLRARR